MMAEQKPNRTTQLQTILHQIRNGLIVSCQALSHEPLYGAEIMARMAIAAEHGGAVAIRANTPADIHAIRVAVELPIIGLYKDDIPGYPVYITPTLGHAKQVAAAGADIIAIDATARPRPHPVRWLPLLPPFTTRRTVSSWLTSPPLTKASPPKLPALIWFPPPCPVTRRIARNSQGLISCWSNALPRN